MRRQDRLLNFPLIHPLLVSLYPVLSLWLANADQLELYSIGRSLVFSAGAAVIACTAGMLLFRNARKAALFSSLLLILFFSYGHVFTLIDEKTIGGFMFGRHRYLVPLWLALFAAGTIAIARNRSKLDRITRIFNLTSLILVGLVLAQAVLLLGPRMLQSAPEKTAVAGAETQQDGGTKRDVYYIILDAYSREDVLAEEHQIDISPFIEQLTDLGFIVDPCAQTNYNWTATSLTSSLNMNYLDALGIPINANEAQINYWDFTSRISYSAVRHKFEAMGYQTAAFKTVYPWLEVADPTYYFDVEQTSSSYDRQESINFQYFFLRTTAMRLLLEAQEKSPERFESLPPQILRFVNPKASLLSSRHFKQYEQNLYAFESLSKLPEYPGPKFVYAHLFSTHQPYVFNVDGSMRWPPLENMQAYNDQILYTNQRMIEILKTIIEKSEIPPVIVVQGDHGYLYDTNRVKILNAFYLPDGGAEKLYPGMTPVNTFRLIFNHYFGENYPLLEDITYYSPREKPYQFEVLPPSCPTGEE